MRTPAQALGTLLGTVLILALAACGLEPHTVAQPEASTQAGAQPGAQVNTQSTLQAAEPAGPANPAQAAALLTAQLNTLINDTDPEAPAYAQRRVELLAQADTLGKDWGLPFDLRALINDVRAFDAPHLRQRWREHQQSLDGAATEYAKAVPTTTSALEGGRVGRRLGPALYLVTLPGGDTAFLSTTRRYRAGARLRGVQVEEQVRKEVDKASGVMETELAEAPKTYIELPRQEAQRRTRGRAPALARMGALEKERLRLHSVIQAELARLDAFTRDANAVLGPRLLGRVESPAPAGFIRGVKRMAKSWSKDQYYRYALPVTGRAFVDAALKAHLEDRRKEVQELLRSTGVGRGRLRANMDLVTFKAFTASPALLSIRFEHYRDTGGAHGNTTYATYVFDLKRNAVLRLENMFTNLPAALAVLSELAALRMDQVMGGAPFPEGYAPKAENFSVFVLDGDALVFTFPPYQVASHAQGTQTLRVPLFHPRLLPLLSAQLLEARGGR